MKPLISVISVNYNGYALTCAMVESLRRHVTSPLEIIVVDNGYVVFEISGGGVLTVVCGIVGELHAGESVICRGRYENHATYGRQFHAQECETDMPKDLEAVYAFWPAVPCRISAQELRIRSLICSALRRWRLSPTTPPG